jgi:hypothetical protein
LFFYFDIQKNKGMHAQISIFLNPIVKAVGLPRFGKEHERNGLTEVVQLQATRAYCI